MRWRSVGELPGTQRARLRRRSQGLMIRGMCRKCLERPESERGLSLLELNFEDLAGVVVLGSCS